MIKILKHTIEIVFISLVALFGFNSCSKNNDVEEKAPEKLFGTWKYQYESTLIKNNGHTDTDDTIKYIDDVSKNLKIEADGTYSIYYIEYVTSSFSTKTELEWGTWKWKNKVLTFTADSIADEDGKSPIKSFSIDLYDKSISLDNHKSYGTSEYYYSAELVRVRVE